MGPPARVSAVVESAPNEEQLAIAPPGELTGTWGIVSAESEGEPLLVPRATLRQEFEGRTVRFGPPDRMAENEYTIDVSAEPPHYNVTQGNRQEIGIFRLERDVLTICAVDGPQTRPDGFSTAPGDGRTLMTFRRMHPDKLGQPLAQNDAEVLARQLEAAANNGDVAALNGLIDLEGILDRITQGLGIPQQQRLSFLFGLKSKSTALAGGPGSLGAKIANIVAEGGLFRVLRVKSDAAGWRVLCRLVAPGGGLNYQEFVLGRDVFGNVVAADVHLFATGELLSATQLRALLPSLSQLSPTVMQQLPASDLAYLQSGEALREYLLLLQAGELEAAEGVFQGLPTSVQAEKWLLLARLNKCGKDDRPRLLLECLNAHPQEPAFQMFAIEDSLIRGDKQRAFDAIDRLQSLVGDDPYLHLMRAKVCENAGQMDEARRLTAKAQAAEPELGRFLDQAPSQ